MARLYKRNGSKQHYVKHAFNKGKYVLWTTYQIYPEAVEFLASKNIKHNGRIPNKLFYILLHNDLIYTNKTGPGVAETTTQASTAKRTLNALSQVTIEASSNESALLNDPFGEDHDAIYVSGFGTMRIPSIPWERPSLKPISEPEGFTLPFEFFSLSLVKSYCIYGSADHDYKLLKNYWRFFELSGRASYSSQSEFNQVLGRFITLMSVIREIAEIAYDETFVVHDERCDWFENMPFIRAELLDRFGAKAFESEDIVHEICSSEVDEVYSGVCDYYTDRDVANSDFESAVMADVRRHLTIGNDIEAHYAENHTFQETGLSPSELRALGFIMNGFVE